MQLRIRQHDGAQRLVPLQPEKSLRLGSDPAADVPLVGTDVLPVHCGVLFREGQFRVVASKKALQVEVNGELVPSAPLEEGDQFKLGDVQVSVVSDAFQLKPAASPKPQPAAAPASTGAVPRPATKPAAGPPKQPAPRHHAAPQPVADELEEVEELEVADELEAADELQPMDDALADAGLTEMSGGLDPLGAGGGLQGYGLDSSGATGLAASEGFGDDLGLGMPAADMSNMMGAEGMAAAYSQGMGGMAGMQPGFAGGMPTAGAVAAPATAAAQPRKPSRLGPVLKVAATLLFVGPAIAVVAVVIARQPTAEQHFQAANELYTGGQSTPAVEAFDVYLSRHPRDARQAEAKVKRRLAQLRPRLTAGGDPFATLGALQQAEQELGPLCRHPVAEEIWSEWGPKVAVALVERAKASTAQPDAARMAQAVSQANAALAWVRRHVPPDVQAARGIDDLDVQVAAFDRNQKQTTAMAAAVSAIQQAVSSNQPAAAYVARAGLLEEYPGLASHTALWEALSGTAAAELGRVQVGAEAPPVERNEAIEPAWLRAIVADTSPAATLAGSGQVLMLPLREHGSVFGIEASTGKVAWRRFVGYDADPLALALAGAPPAVLLFGGLRNELIRATAATGRGEWRLPLGSPAVGGAVLGETAYITTRAGAVWQVDANSGAVAARYELPLPARVGPVVDPASKRLFQFADQAQLFVIGSNERKCLASVYVGHEAGSVVFAPLLVGNLLVVVERDGLRDTRLSLFDIENTPRRVDQLPVRGIAKTPPVAADSIVFLATDDGVIHSLELVVTDRKASFKRGPAWSPPSGSPAATMHLSIVKGRLFAAGAGLRTFPLVWRDAPVASEVFPATEPLSGAVLVAGGHAVVVRQRPGGGLQAAPIGPPAAWTTHLAAAPAADPVSEGNGSAVWTMSRDGGVFRTSTTNSDELGAPAFSVETPAKATRGWIVPSGQHIAAGMAGASSLALDSVGKSQPRSVRLPGRLAGMASDKSGPLWLALETGSIVLLDPASGEIQGTPLLPAWQPGRPLDLFGPLPLAQGGAALVMQGKLHLLAIETAPALRPIVKQTIALVGTPLAAATAGDAIWIVDGANRALGWNADGLSPLGELPLASEPIWGPIRVGPAILLALADGRLLRLGNQPGPIWESSSLTAAPVGAALIDANRLVIATRGGALILLDAESGQPIGEPLETQQSLAGNPCLAGDRLFVATTAGCLLEVRKSQLGASTTAAAAQP